MIETASERVTATIPFRSPPYISPFDVAVTPDGRHVYVTDDGSNTVLVIATATNRVTATIPVGNTPHGVAVTPDGRHVYVANNLSNTVSVIKTANNTVTATILVGSDACSKDDVRRTTSSALCRRAAPIGVFIQPMPRRPR